MNKALKLMALLLLPVAASAEMQVYTTSFLNIKKQGLEATIYYLDEPDMILSELSHSSGFNPDRAQQKALERLGSEKGKMLLKRLEHSFEGVLGAWGHHLNYLPAVVINDSYVIYGVSDLGDAQEFYRAYMDEDVSHDSR